MISFKPLERTLRNKGLSVNKLRELSGIQITDISNRIQGKKSVRVNFVEKICKTLGCSIQDVIEYSKEDVNLEKLDIKWDKLASIMKDNGFTFVSLAETLGYSKSFFLTAKSRKSKIKLTTLEDICNLLNCSKEDLIS